MYFSEVSTRALGNRFAQLSVIVCMYVRPNLIKKKKERERETK